MTPEDRDAERLFAQRERQKATMKLAVKLMKHCQTHAGKRFVYLALIDDDVGAACLHSTKGHTRAEQESAKEVIVSGLVMDLTGVRAFIEADDGDGEVQRRAIGASAGVAYYDSEGTPRIAKWESPSAQEFMLEVGFKESLRQIREGTDTPDTPD